LTELPVPPRQTANGAAIEPALEALIMKCLAKDPNERFSHILELRDGLLHLLGGFETHPPSYATLGQTAMPLPPPAMVTTVPTPPVSSQVLQLSSLSGMGSSPSIYSQYSLPETVPPEPVTPWWVWFVGGAFAV